MELKPGYKQTEVGVIPDEWRLSTVGQEFEIQLGKMLDAEKNTGAPKPYLGNKAVQWDRIDLSELPSMAMTRSDMDRFRLRRGDLLVCEGGEIGRGAVWDAPIDECYYQKALHRLRPLRGFEPRLMLALLRHWTEQGLLTNYVTQTSIAHLTREKLAEVPLPVPEPEEQRAIAEALGDVDALLHALTRLIAKKRDLKQVAMQQLLTGQQRLPGFSGEWEVKRFGKVVDVDPENLASNTPPSYAFNYISLEDVDLGTLQHSSEQVFSTAPSRARRKLRKGDILVSTVRPNLKSHLLFNIAAPHWVCSTGFSVLRCKEGATHPGYVFFHLFGHSISRQIEMLLTGSNYPAINSGDVRALQIPLPGLAEQTAIATVLSDMDAELAALEARLAKTRALKQGIMQELLTGKTRLV